MLTLDWLYLLQNNRIRRDCPVPGCNARALSRLAGHLQLVHHQDQATRKKWLNIARKVNVVNIHNYIAKRHIL